jgi:DNA polymerase-3 subunit epsilon
MAVPSSQARREAAHLARVRLQSNPLYLDTETTGLGPQDEVIEVCLLESDGSVLFESLVRPAGPIPLDAVRVHGISDDMVARAPGWPEVWAGLQPRLAGRAVAVYNAEFDLRLLRQSLARHALPDVLEPSTFFCLMLLYAQFRAEWDASRRSYRWHSLETARRQAGLPYPNAHRARDDAFLARALLQHMASSA